MWLVNWTILEVLFFIKQSIFSLEVVGESRDLKVKNKCYHSVVAFVVNDVTAVGHLLSK